MVVRRDLLTLTACFFIAVYVLLYGAARSTHLLVFSADLCGPGGVVATRQLEDEPRAAVDVAFGPLRVVETEARYFWAAIRSRMPGR